MRERPKDAGNGIVLPGREREGVASSPDEFPADAPRCDHCVHVVWPAGSALILPAANNHHYGVILCGKFRDDATGQPQRACWWERYGTAMDTEQGMVKIGRCGPRAEYFERRKP